MSTRRDDMEDLQGFLPPLDAGPGPARPLPPGAAKLLVSSVLDAAGYAPARAVVKPRFRFGGWVLAGTVLAGASAAAVWSVARRAWPSAPPPVVSAPRAAAPVVPPELPVEAPAVPEEAPAVEPAPEPLRRSADSRAHTASRARMSEDWLRQANARRAAGRWREAEALYLRVIREFPRTDSAYVARVASGSLRLEHFDDPRGALRQLQAAQRQQPRGPLTEEVLHGMAEAHRSLGSPRRERETLERLVATFPNSPLRAQAQRRLDALAGRVR